MRLGILPGSAVLLMVQGFPCSLWAKGPTPRYQPATPISQRIAAAAKEMGLHLRLQRPEVPKMGRRPAEDEEPEEGLLPIPDSPLYRLTVPLRTGGQLQVDYTQKSPQTQPQIHAFQHRPRPGPLPPDALAAALDHSQLEDAARPLLTLFGKPVAVRVERHRSAPDRLSLWAVVQQPDGTQRWVSAEGRQGASRGDGSTAADLTTWLTARLSTPPRASPPLPASPDELNEYLDSATEALAKSSLARPPPPSRPAPFQLRP